MKRAPRVLVLARFRDTDTAHGVARNMAGQSYQHTRLVLVARDGTNTKAGADVSQEIVCENELAKIIATSGEEMILFLPDVGHLREAGLEKLVLALELAPDQDGVADQARGSNGLWLARNNERMKSFAGSWLNAESRWRDGCLDARANLFHIDEDLVEGKGHPRLHHSTSVEAYFPKLPPHFEIYQQISEGLLWDLPADGVDERSVFFLVSSLPMGGACKFVLDVVGQLKANGHRVMVATTAYESKNPNPWLDELLRIIPDVFVLSHARPVDMPRLIVHLARARRCGRVVISHSILGYQLLPWMRTQLPDVSFIDYTHIEYETEYPKGGYAQRAVNYRSLLELSMVSSEHLRGWMVEHGTDGEGVKVCHTNIDTERWKPRPDARAQDRSELGINRKTVMMLYPCRMAEQKRPDLMCNIVARLKKTTHLPFVVVVAGDGPLMPALKNFVEVQGLEDNFRLLGAVPLDRMAQLHNAADILLLPSMIEGIALALFEAMALESVPVVADVGGQRELVTPECGYLIPLGEARKELIDYVTVLKQLLENPERLRQHAVACRKRVAEHFQLTRMCANFIATLKDAGLRHRHRRVALPEAGVCRDLATMAIDRVRLNFQGAQAQDLARNLQELTTRQEKIIMKLKRQLEAARSAKLPTVPEANEIFS